MVQRQIIWNYTSTDNPESHHMMALIINTPLEIKRITQKIYETFQPIIDEQIRNEGKVNGLAYKLVSFDTPRQPNGSDWSFVYNGRVRRDKKAIYERKRTEGLPNYIDEHLTSMTG